MIFQGFFDHYNLEMKYNNSKTNVKYFFRGKTLIIIYVQLKYLYIYIQCISSDSDLHQASKNVLTVKCSVYVRNTNSSIRFNGHNIMCIKLNLILRFTVDQRNTIFID